MKYPTKIEVNNRIYNIDTNYQTALDCFTAINDNEIGEVERALAVITLLLGKDVLPDDYEECLKKCAIYLRCGKEENDKIEEATMDYFQDESYIRTSIRQCYHINLNDIEYMHWWEYNELIEGLTEETILSRIRDIRSRDINDEPNEKAKRQLKEAKEQVALKKNKFFTKEQQDSINKFKELAGIRK